MSNASAPRLGQVLLAGLEQDRLALDVVAHGDHALLDLGERAGARVLDQPLSAADRGRGVLAARAEGARAVAPELARLRLLRARLRALAARRERLVWR